MPDNCDYCGEPATTKRDIPTPDGVRLDVPLCSDCADAYDDGKL